MLPAVSVSSPTDTNQGLPSFEVCQLCRPALRFVPAKACPAFARVLLLALRLVLIENSEEAWYKLFVTKMCLMFRGRRIKHTSIDVLCKLWTINEYGTLWNLTKGNTLRKETFPQKLIESAIFLANAGMFEKACNIVLSAGLARNNDAMWQLLLSKHPSCPPPVATAFNMGPHSHS